MMLALAVLLLLLVVLAGSARRLRAGMAGRGAGWQGGCSWLVLRPCGRSMMQVRIDQGFLERVFVFFESVSATRNELRTELGKLEAQMQLSLQT
jgi:hypothetical protein